MNDCPKIHPLLSQYLEGELSSKEKRLVAWHLNQCASARKELYEVERLRKRLADMPEPPFPVDLHERIMDAVYRPHLVAKPGASEDAPGLARLFLPRFLLKPVWGLAAVGLVAFAFFFTNPDWMSRLKNADYGMKGSGAQGSGLESTALPPENLQQTPVQGFAPEETPDDHVGGLPGAGETVPAPAVAKFRKSAPAAPDASTASAAPTTAMIGKADLSAEPTREPANARERLTGIIANVTRPRPSKKTTTGGSPASSLVQSLAHEEETLSASGRASADTALGLVENPREPASMSGLPRWSGANARAATETQELITDAQTLKVYWTLLNPGEPPPDVDFEDRAVVVLVSSQKPTAGWRILLDRIEDAPSNTVIWYREESPAPEGFVAQVLTRPWTLQVVPKPAKPVVFKKRD